MEFASTENEKHTILRLRLSKGNSHRHEIKRNRINRYEQRV